MHFSVFAVAAALSATVYAQSLDGIPTCAQTCFEKSTNTCSGFDVACICRNFAGTTSPAGCCVIQTCSSADLQTTMTFATALCSGAGVTINTSPDCASSSGSSNSSSPSATTSPTRASGSASASTSAASSASGAAASGNAGAALLQSAGTGVGLGAAIAGLLAAL